MKRQLLWMIASLLLLGQMAMAQKIDQRLTNLIHHSAQFHAPAQQANYLKAACDCFCISLTPDGNISSFGVTAYLKKSGLVAYGEEPVITYLAELEGEITTIRMILTGRLAGIEPQVIKERLRDLYA